ELCYFISKLMPDKITTMDKLDDIMEQSNIASEQIHSDLAAVKELNYKFSRVLENSSDLICFIDENRRVSYMNPSYKKYFPDSSKHALGKDLKDIAPDGLRMKVFNTREKVENLVYHKEGTDIISTIEPIYIDDKFKGIIAILRPVSQIRNVLNKLEKSQEEANYYKEELFRYSKVSESFSNIIGSNRSLQDCLYMAEKASKSISTVLIRGESGTGKELIAKAIHKNSKRKDKPFIRVNCAAIPENLLESELFGYEKGAFTGAVKSKPGKFSLADGGTIFLDEIGDMQKSMQIKLLRVLQEREFESVGGLTTQKVDVRVIAATNRHLEEMIEKGEFREDLYYRLNVITIQLPPLRIRKEDISLLVEHFISKINGKLEKDIQGISKEALAYLQDYNWPGNIRELENIIERAINMCEGTIITEVDLPTYLTNITPRREGNIKHVNGDMPTMDEYEKEIITMAMQKYKSFNKAGKVLGLSHRTVAAKCEKYGIAHDNKVC
ncbi:MAG: sigma 54-interacting transcriptional regulator, partial [Bacillota bacterium]|nr:sigma 54-interacting transcriptional regulator [Bacillota bacterium]